MRVRPRFPTFSCQVTFRSRDLDRHACDASLAPQRAAPPPSKHRAGARASAEGMRGAPHERAGGAVESSGAPRSSQRALSTRQARRSRPSARAAGAFRDQRAGVYAGSEGHGAAMANGVPWAGDHQARTEDRAAADRLASPTATSRSTPDTASLNCAAYVP